MKVGFFFLANCHGGWDQGELERYRLNDIKRGEGAGSGVGLAMASCKISREGKFEKKGKERKKKIRNIVRLDILPAPAAQCCAPAECGPELSLLDTGCKV